MFLKSYKMLKKKTIKLRKELNFFSMKELQSEKEVQ
jgi:hypothetical protein